MNDRYFICQTCKVYRDAGYRHCYWTLEHRGVAARGQAVDVAAVRATVPYWDSGGDSGDRTSEGLSAISAFLRQHETHSLIYGEWDDFIADEDYDTCAFLDWMNAEFDGVSGYFCVPRDFVEHLGLPDWTSVEEFVSGLERKPLWWGQTSCEEAARERFESLLAQQRQQSYQH